jgi:hypothetical protein
LRPGILVCRRDIIDPWLSVFPWAHDSARHGAVNKPLPE